MKISNIFNKIGLSRQSKIVAFRETQSFNNIGVIVIATFLIGVAVRLLVESNFGLGSFDAFAIGLQNKFDIPILSLAIWSTSGCIIIIAFILGEKPKLYNFLTLGLLGVSIEMTALFIGTSDNILSNIAMFITGFVLLSIGVSIFSYTQVGGGSIELMMFALNKKFKFNLLAARWFIDLSLLIGAFVLGGPIGIGTLILAIGTAPMAQIFSNHILYISAGKAAVKSCEQNSYEELDTILKPLVEKL